MENTSLQTSIGLFIGLCLIGSFLGLIVWAFIYNLRHKEDKAAALIARTGWKHELVGKGTVERRFSSTTNGIEWKLEYKISRYDSEHTLGQLDFPKILEWQTSAVKLPAGTVVIITIPQVDREVMELTYKVMLQELDIWLSSDLSPQQIGSISFQGRYIVMANTEEDARRILSAAENPLLRWPEWEISRLVAIPTPVLVADPNGIMIRIALNGLDLPSRVQELNEPYVDRVLAVVRLGVDIATGLRDSR